MTQTDDWGHVDLSRSHRSGSMICPNPNCGYKGGRRKVARGNAIVGVLLCCFFLLPGVLYFMFFRGYRYYCPKCGMQIGADV